MYRCIKDVIGLMHKNYMSYRMKLPYDGEYINHYGALIGAVNGTSIDTKKVKDIRIKISKETPWHSELRGDALYTTSYILALDKEIEIDDYLKVYNKLLDKEIKESYTLPFISYIVLKEMNDNNIDDFVNRTQELYKAMKETEAEITFTDDYLYCALLSLKRISYTKYKKVYGKIHEKLEPLNHISNNDLQSLVNLIIFLEDDKIEEKLLKVVNKLEEEGIKVRSENIMQIGIGCKFLSEKEIIEGILEISKSLNEYPEYELFMDKSFRLLMNTTILNMYVNREKEELILMLFSISVMEYLRSRKQSVIMSVNS